jgi:ABC-type microcin C transport system permease subunit YejB
MSEKSPAHPILFDFSTPIIFGEKYIVKLLGLIIQIENDNLIYRNV